MHKKFEIYRTKIEGGSQLGRKVVTHNSNSNLPLEVRTMRDLDLATPMKIEKKRHFYSHGTLLSTHVPNYYIIES